MQRWFLYRKEIETFLKHQININILKLYHIVYRYTSIDMIVTKQSQDDPWQVA